MSDGWLCMFVRPLQLILGLCREIEYSDSMDNAWVYMLDIMDSHPKVTHLVFLLTLIIASVLVLRGISMLIEWLRLNLHQKVWWPPTPRPRSWEEAQSVPGTPPEAIHKFPHPISTPFDKSAQQTPTSNMNPIQSEHMKPTPIEHMNPTKFEHMNSTQSEYWPSPSYKNTAVRIDSKVFCATCAEGIEERVHTFVWMHGGQEVYVTGSFASFNILYRLTLLPDSGEHGVTLILPTGHHLFKYRVDGQWKIDPAHPQIHDPQGRTNNIMHI